MVNLSFTSVDDPLAGASSSGTFIYAINASGDVAGTYYDGSGNPNGFDDDGGIYTTIDDPERGDDIGSATFVDAIDASGEVVAGSYNDSSGNPNGFIDDDGTYTTVDPLGLPFDIGGGSYVEAINASGEAAGYYFLDSTGKASGFVYDNGTFTSIDDPLAGSGYGTTVQAINASGEVAGNYYDGSGNSNGFVYDDGTFTTIDDPESVYSGTFVVAINASGEVAGNYFDASDVVRGFVYDNGIYTTIDDPLGVDGTAVAAINAAGEVVGDYSDSSGKEHGYVYDDGIYTTVDDLSAVAGTYVEAINDTGQIAGYYFGADGSHGFVATPEAVACYCAGTRIATPAGEVPVETLAIGDRVVTQSGEARRIKWIGRRSYCGRFVMGRDDILPICIKAGALDEDVPRRDLWISPHHAMYFKDMCLKDVGFGDKRVEGVLIEARDLLNGVSIMQAERVEKVEYFHIELDSHDVIVAEGAPSETFIDDDSRAMFHNAQEYRSLYPGIATGPAQYCAPRVADGYAIEAARRRIALRAGRRAQAEELHAGGLRGFIDVVSAERVAGWAQNVDYPEAPVCLDIYADGRLIGQTLANRYREDLEKAGLGSGRHSFAFTPSAGITLAADTVEVLRSLDGAVVGQSRHPMRVRAVSA